MVVDFFINTASAASLLIVAIPLFMIFPEILFMLLLFSMIFVGAASKYAEDNATLKIYDHNETTIRICNKKKCDGKIMFKMKGIKNDRD